MRVRIQDRKHAGPEVGKILLHLSADSSHTLSLFERDPHTSIHGLRTNMKKIRSLLFLVRLELPEEQTKAALALVRKLKNHYANSRDEEILRRCFLSLASKNDAELVEELFQAPGAPPILPSLALKSDCKRLGELLKSMPFWVVTTDGMLTSLSSTLRRNRRRHQACSSLSVCDEDFHEWRKAVKHLWVQSKVLRVLDDRLKGVPKRANALGELLGEINDFSNLWIRLEDSASKKLSARFFRDLEKVVRKRRIVAIRKGSKLYSRLDSLRKLP